MPTYLIIDPDGVISNIVEADDPADVTLEPDYTIEEIDEEVPNHIGLEPGVSPANPVMIRQVTKIFSSDDPGDHPFPYAWFQIDDDGVVLQIILVQPES